MPEYRNFRAWIFCDGVPLPEYCGGPDPDDHRIYTCWVPSELGKAFTVRWMSGMGDVCDNLGIVYIDGVKVDGRLDVARHLTHRESMGVRLNGGTIRPYVFAPTVLTDDDSYLGIQQSPDLSELGNITIKISLVLAQRQFLSRAWVARNREEVELYDGAIHETSKKICDHRVMLGVPVRPRNSYVPTGPRRSVLTNRPYDRSDKGPYVTFRFKYRPMSYLKAQGLLPAAMNEINKEVIEIVHIPKGPRAAAAPSPAKPSFLHNRLQTPSYTDRTSTGTPIKNETTPFKSGIQGTPLRKISAGRKRGLSEMSASARNVLAAEEEAAYDINSAAAASTPGRNAGIVIKQTESTRKMMLNRRLVFDSDHGSDENSNITSKRMKLGLMTPTKNVLLR